MHSWKLKNSIIYPFLNLVDTFSLNLAVLSFQVIGVFVGPCGSH